MRVAVTGGSGFAGRHLLRELLRAGHTVTDLDVSPPPSDLSGVSYRPCDVTQETSVLDAIRQEPYDAGVHLAGIAFVPRGWTEPKTTFRVNLRGTIHMLEAFRTYRPSARLLVVTSAEIYGKPNTPEPINEECHPNPVSLYAVSKLAADMVSRLYAKRYGMPVIVARPANHIGPGQSQDFAISSFARQFAEIKLGRRGPQVAVGNLDAQRSFLDVRDTALAYRLLLEAGAPGKAYNIASPQIHTIRQLFEMLREIAGVTAQPIVVESLYRPADRAPLLDISRIMADVGWKPSIPIHQTLEDMLSDWMQRIGK